MEGGAIGGVKTLLIRAVSSLGDCAAAKIVVPIKRVFPDRDVTVLSGNT